jgi:arylsulfatase A-like enzyme
LWCKHSNFEQATRSPLIFSSPTIPGFQKTDAPVEFVDIFPTLCDLVGVPVPEHLDGVSLVPLMRNPASSVKEVAVSQWPAGQSTGYALRDKRYRYVEWLERGDSTLGYDENAVVGRELYDYENDPMETVNVADHPEYRSIAKKMNQQMREFFNEQSK